MDAAVERVHAALAEAPPKSSRMLSLDALRGFDMLWIIGVDQIIYSVQKAFPSRVTEALATQFEHATWEGFHFYDLIFPLFVFLVGITTVFSLSKAPETGSKAAVYKRMARRFLLLYLLAFVHDGVLWGENIRMLGVLQRIAWCYLFTSLLYMHLRVRGLIVVFAVILIGYWALMTFVPPPGEDAPTFAMHRNWSNRIDSKLLLPGDWEPRGWRNEGYLSTLPAIATCILGTFTGVLLKAKNLSDAQKLCYMAVGGALLLIAGYIWGLQFPVIKRIWTSTYVLVAGGYSLLLLAAFYYIVDIRGWRKWATPFFWIGANAIVAYVLASIAPWGWFMGPFANWLAAYCGGMANVLAAAVIPSLVILLMYVMYRKQWYLRV